MPIPTLAAHGADIPAIGFGTARLGSSTAAAVEMALRCGYRHIDAARKYYNEERVGEGLRASGVPRSDLFITTKVAEDDLRAADFARSTKESLSALGLDHVDLLLIHWPNLKIPLAETVGALNEMKRQGMTRHIGVANFPIRLLDEAIRLSPAPLVTNQVEVHAYIDQTTLLAACGERGLVVTAYCPLGRGRLIGDPVLARIAKAHGRTVAQVALRYLVQQGNIVPIPRSSHPERIVENFAVFDFALSEEELARIAALTRPDGRIANLTGRVGAWD
jgi:2,5-diketo-D-gluconate reductase B